MVEVDIDTLNIIDTLNNDIKKNSNDEEFKITDLSKIEYKDERMRSNLEIYEHCVECGRELIGEHSSIGTIYIDVDIMANDIGMILAQYLVVHGDKDKKPNKELKDDCRNIDESTDEDNEGTDEDNDGTDEDDDDDIINIVQCMFYEAHTSNESDIQQDCIYEDLSKFFDEFKMYTGQFS